MKNDNNKSSYVGRSLETFFYKLPIGLIMVAKNTLLMNANEYIFRYFNQDISEPAGLNFGNLFNCTVVAGTNKLCGTSERCEFCDIRNGITQVLKNNIIIEDIELCHDFTINGRQTTKWFKISASRAEQNGEIFALVAFTDITDIKASEKELIKLGITDELTGLYNHGYIIKKLENTIKENEEKSFPLSIAMVDIDKFKDINDRYGHIVGDEVLSDLANLFKKHTRNTDCVGRYGGDEFLFLFSESDINSTKKVLKRISEKFKDIKKDTIELSLTISIGLVCIDNYNIANGDVLDIIEYADNLLYKAKRSGRNRIEAGHYFK